MKFGPDLAGWWRTHGDLDTSADVAVASVGNAPPGFAVINAVAAAAFEIELTIKELC